MWKDTIGPDGPVKREDSSRNVIAGEALVAGQVVVPDYANASTIAGGSTPGTPTHPESVYIKVGTSTATLRGQMTTPFGVVTKGAAKGELAQVCFEGYASVTLGANATAYNQVGITTASGVIGAVTAGAGLILGQAQESKTTGNACKVYWMGCTARIV